MMTTIDEATRARDEAALRTLVAAVATLADLGEFETLERIYAAEVLLDYTSLAGGEPEVISNTALMTRWAGVLPGFDRTLHQVSDIEVTCAGSKGAATAQLIADHWLGSDHWRITGQYTFGFVSDGERWRISQQGLQIEAEQGNRSILAAAAARAAEEPVGWLVRQKARELVMDFLGGLEEKDMARVNGVWADDAVQHMPYVPSGMSSSIVGREALIKHYSRWPEQSGAARFTDDMRFYPTRDPAIVIAEFTGFVDVVTTGREYRQHYLGIWHADAGKVSLYREYFEPAAFAHAFALEGASA